MKVKYRTVDGEYNVWDYPFIDIEQPNGVFTILAYPDDFSSHQGTPVAGIADVVEFELFDTDLHETGN